MKDLAHFKEKSLVKHHFVPNKDTKKRARLLHHKFFYIYSSIFVVLFLLINVSKSIKPGVLGYSSEITVRQLLDGTNKEREKNGKKPLVINEKLSKAAKLKADYMFSKNFWAHTAPDGTQPWEFVLKEGYDYAYAGENLARNFYYSQEVVDAWMNSPSHKENLLSENYDEVGFAVENGILDGYETALVVQFFGRPKNLAAITTTEDQSRYLNSLNENVSTMGISTKTNSNSATVDIPSLFRYIAFTILGFVLALFILDIYYSKTRGVDKFTGHTSAHIMVLLVTMFSVYIIFKNGNIL
jgi:hypothetical protein